MEVQGDFQFLNCFCVILHKNNKEIGNHPVCESYIERGKGKDHIQKIMIDNYTHLKPRPKKKFWGPF